jgi:hypothetical protein
MGTRIVFDHQLRNLSGFPAGNFREQFESQIESRRDARSGPYLAGPDDPAIGDGGCAKTTERRLRPPMGCCALSLEETGGGQNKRA